MVLAIKIGLDLEGLSIHEIIKKNNTFFPV